MFRTTRRCQGFTLVELSIVLVIIGLLVGGILEGESLIHNTQLRTVITQQNEIHNAVTAFKDQYSALPGDMTNATSFWGTNACPNTPATGTATCNGNGDKILTPNPNAETFLFWQHLANAGLIEGSYTGVPDGAQPYSATVNNSFNGKIRQSLWWVWSWGSNVTGDSQFFDGNYVNMLEFGVASGLEPTPIFNPQDVAYIDAKMDDGMPATGKMVSRVWNGCTNATSGSQFQATYLLSSSSKACSPFFHL